jgi:FdhD protein
LTWRWASACGICGSASIEAVRTRSRHDLTTDDVRIDARVLAGLRARIQEAQAVLERTVGLHAAALFTPAGDLVCLREDVGRHNAVDKVVGWAFAAGRLPLRGQVLQVSGRASFELAQKAWMAGCPALAAVSAPSSLAAELARDAGMTLVGFSRGDLFSVYSGEPRIAPGPGDGGG